MKRAGAAAVACAILGLWASTGGCRKESLTPPEGPDVRRPAAEWLKEESIRLLRDYVRIDTTNPSPGEAEGAKFLAAFFDCAGIENETVCPAPGRCNLLARLPGKRREGAILLLNHIDVAEAYPQAWTESTPFGGDIKNGFLWGRGTYDMKSIAIAEALAMRRLKERGIVPNSDVLFLAEADEETEQRWGSRWLLEHRPEWFAGVTNVLNEGGSNEMILRTVRYWGIETIQAGYALAELEADAAPALQALEARYPTVDGPVVEPHPHVVMGFNMLADHLASPLTDPMRHLDRVRQNKKELAILPDRYGAFLEARSHWIGPYPYPPAKPTASRAYLVISVPPGLDPRPYLTPILDGLPAGVRVIRTAFGGPAGASPYPTVLTDVLKRVTEAYTPGTPFGPMPTFGGFTTTILFRERGFAAYGYSPIGMNITDSSRRHGNDERVFLRDYLIGCAMYADSLEEFMMLPEPAEMSVAPRAN
jgi:acetylornithine deacetylase/succinyl-diaminopimelate desuccinylase-like protein